MSDTVLNQFTPPTEEEEIDVSRKLKIGIIGTAGLPKLTLRATRQMPERRDRRRRRPDPRQGGEVLQALRR